MKVKQGTHNLKDYITKTKLSFEDLLKKWYRGSEEQIYIQQKNKSSFSTICLKQLSEPISMFHPSYLFLLYITLLPIVVFTTSIR